MTTYNDRHRGDTPTLDRAGWIELYAAPMNHKRTSGTRCDCGALVCFDTDHEGSLVTLDARTRERHDCGG